MVWIYGGGFVGGSSAPDRIANLDRRVLWQEMRALHRHLLLVGPRAAEL